MSYAFNSDDEFFIGGTIEEYEALVCEPEDEDDDECDADNPEELFDEETVVSDNAIPTAATDLSFAEPLNYSGFEVRLKTADYIPPIKKEKYERVLAVDTWYR